MYDRALEILQGSQAVERHVLQRLGELGPCDEAIGGARPDGVALNQIAKLPPLLLGERLALVLPYAAPYRFDVRHLCFALLSQATFDGQVVLPAIWKGIASDQRTSLPG